MSTAYSFDTITSEIPDVVLPGDGKQGQLRPLASALTEEERKNSPWYIMDRWIPASDFCERAHNMQPCTGGLTYPAEDGSYENGVQHVRTFNDDDGVTRITAFAPFTAENLGVEEGEGAHGSFDLLKLGFCGGDKGLAARIASHFIEAGDDKVDDFFELLSTQPQVDDLRVLFPIQRHLRALPAPSKESRTEAPTFVGEDGVERATPETMKGLQALGEAHAAAHPEGGDGPLEGNTLPEEKSPSRWAVSHLIRDGINGGTARIDMGDGESLRIAGKETGYYVTKVVQAEDGGEKYIDIRIADYVPWRSKVTEFREIDSDGHAKTVGEPSYTVQLIDSDGEVFEEDGFNRADSADIRKVVERMDAGVKLPLKADDRLRMNNALLAAGRKTEQERSEVYTSTGYLDVNGTGKHALVMPAGSISAEGVVDNFTVDAPLGSAKDALKPAQKKAGFTRVTPDDKLREEAQALPAFLGITKKNPLLGITHLGAMSAGHLVLSRRCLVFYSCAPDAGKSLFISAGQTFLSGVGLTGSHFWASFQRATVPGMMRTAGWSKNIAAAYDDFRISGDRNLDDKMRACIEILAQASYGADDDTKSNSTSGLAASKDLSTLSIVAGEGAPPSGQAVIGRMIVVNVEYGDIDIAVRGESALDRFRAEYANTGIARSVWANYLQWLVGQVDLAGGVVEFGRICDEIKANWLRKYAGAGRAAENAAVIGAGWEMLLMWAEAKGISDLLPTLDEVSELLVGAIQENSTAAEEAGFGPRFIDTARDLLANRSAYVEGYNGDAPSGKYVREYGYEPGYNGGMVPLRGALRLGVLSKCGNYVQLSNAGVKGLLARLDTKMSAPQIRTAFTKILVPGTRAGQEAPAFMGISVGRPRGYIVPAGILGLPSPEEGTETEAEQETF